MVVSFANASLLTLGEAIGVIMGANIGTTVTAWLISILGFKVSMSAVAIPLVGVGFLMSLSKRKNLKNWGRFIIGFSILFIGLQFLKDSVPDLNQHPETFAFLSSYTDKGYLSVLLFLAIGTLLTVILQSSSATMALTLIMCFEGWIPFQMAAAMVLGENIGTTITANLAAWIGNHHAKRAARAHLIFNLIGVAWMLLLFWFFLDLIDAVVQRIESASPFVQTSAIPVALSLFHTSFNIINTSLLLGFIGLIYKDKEAALKMFASLGVRDEVRVDKRKPDYQGCIRLRDCHGWHERGLFGFDPDIEVEGLSITLSSPTPEKSLFIWNKIKMNLNHWENLTILFLNIRHL